jgi:hypothetical protein
MVNIRKKKCTTNLSITQTTPQPVFYQKHAGSTFLIIPSEKGSAHVRYLHAKLEDQSPKALFQTTFHFVRRIGKLD